jgi:hypothetical protein
MNHQTRPCQDFFSKLPGFGEHLRHTCDDRPAECLESCTAWIFYTIDQTHFAAHSIIAERAKAQPVAQSLAVGGGSNGRLRQLEPSRYAVCHSTTWSRGPEGLMNGTAQLAHYRRGSLGVHRSRSFPIRTWGNLEILLTALDHELRRQVPFAGHQHHPKEV